MENFELFKNKKENSLLKSIRIKETTLDKINVLAAKNDLSVNRVINECIEFALANLNDMDKQKQP